MSKNLKGKYLEIAISNQRTAKIKDKRPNLQPVSQTETFKYTVPSSSLYPHQWLWDSCFHAIIYTRLGDHEFAKQELLSLLAGQWENGMIPHMIYWGESEKQRQNWGTEKNTSSITQPPMIAYAVETVYEETEDKDFIKKVYRDLDRYYKWLHKDRSTDSALLSIIHPWESGKDDFVPWDKVMKLHKPSKKEHEDYKLFLLDQYVKMNLNTKKFLEKDLFNVKSLLFNCIYLRNLKSMKKLGEIINKDTTYYSNTIKRVEESAKEHLYNPKLGIYTSIYNENTSIDDVDNPAVFLPLFAGLNTQEEAKELVEKVLLDTDTFWTSYPIPTISVDNDNFEPNRYWRGSSWININWFVYQGLKDYKLNKVAKKLKQKSVNMVEKSGFHEYYNSINGKGRGPSDFCWSGLIFDM